MEDNKKEISWYENIDFWAVAYALLAFIVFIALCITVYVAYLFSGGIVRIYPI